jgi:hypothetical protein
MTRSGLLVGVGLLATLACVAAGNALELILPGLTFHRGSEGLQGRLLLLADRSLVNDGQERTQPSVICEYDLESRGVTALAASPSGVFVAAEDGSACSVLFGKRPGLVVDDTQAFLLSTVSGVSCTVHIGSLPRGTLLLSEQALFRMSGSSKNRLLWFDINTGTERTVRIPGVPMGAEHGRVESVFVTPGDAVRVRFEYRTSALGVKSGYYDLDIATGEVVWHSTESGRPQGYGTLDGEFVWFAGPNGPLVGSELVCGPTDRGESLALSTGQKTVRVLHRFPGAPKSADYFLQGVSPCRGFALVRRSKSIVPMSGQPSETREYFLVNLAHGETRLVFDDQVAKKTKGRVSDLWWVAARESSR